MVMSLLPTGCAWVRDPSIALGQDVTQALSGLADIPAQVQTGPGPTEVVLAAIVCIATAVILSWAVCRQRKE
jgi:hypothetical protein